MSIQSLDINNQNRHPAMTDTDLKASRKDAKDPETALNSGDEDQVTLSENAVASFNKSATTGNLLLNRVLSMMNSSANNTSSNNNVSSLAQFLGVHDITPSLTALLQTTSSEPNRGSTS